MYLSHRSKQIVPAVLILWTAFTGAPVSAEPKQPSSVHLRPSCPWIKEAIRAAYEESLTFRRLVDQIEAAQTFVFVEGRACGTFTENPCTFIGSSGSGARWVQIRAGRMANQPQLTGILAHELQHAIEIIQNPDVVDSQSLRSLYRRIGYFTHRAGIQEWWETTQALETERTVLKEARQSQRLARAGAQR